MESVNLIGFDEINSIFRMVLMFVDDIREVESEIRREGD